MLYSPLEYLNIEQEKIKVREGVTEPLEMPASPPPPPRPLEKERMNY